MSTTFVRSTESVVASGGGGSTKHFEFGSAIPDDHLIIVVVHNNPNPEVTPPAGWVEAFTLLPYEGDKLPVSVFAKICDGGSDFNASGVAGRVGPFTGVATGKIYALEVSGATSATPSYTDTDTAVVESASPYTTTMIASAGTDSFCLMVQAGVFGDAFAFAASGSSNEIEGPYTGGNGAGLYHTGVYRVGSGSVNLAVATTSNTATMWRQSGVAVWAAAPEPGIW